MESLRQLEAPWLVRGILVVTLVAFSTAAGAQSGGNASSSPQSTAPTPSRPAVAPPPADLEPGVNTSATQMSSPEPAPAPPAAQKPAPTPAKPARGAGSATGPAASGGTTSAPSSAPNAITAAPATTAAPAANAPTGAPSAGGAGAAGTARTGAVPKSGATAAAGAAAGKAHDSLQLDTTQITGNRELPKVLYIVPWKRSDLGDLVGKPVNSLLDEVLTPVDRDVFKRQNRYYDALKPDAPKDGAGAAAGADVKH
jgi:hypothetical protein